MELVGADALDAIEIGMHLDEFRWDRELVETRGERLALTRDVFRFVDGVGGEAETESVSVNECDASGRLVAVTAFDADDLPRALELLEARYAELGPEEVRRVSTAPPVPGNAAWRSGWRMRDCALRGDWDGFVDNLDGLVQTDLRRGLGMRISGDDVLEMNRTLFSVANLEWEATLVATRGDRLALVRHAVRFVDGAAGLSEVEAVNVEECGPDGRMVAIAILDPDDLARAYELLDARHAELGAG